MGRATTMLLSMFLFSLFLHAMGYESLGSMVLGMFSGDPSSMPFVAKFALFTALSVISLGVTFFSNAPILVQAGIAFFTLISYPYSLLAAEQMPFFVKTLLTGVWVILWMMAAIDLAGRGNA